MKKNVCAHFLVEETRRISKKSGFLAIVITFALAACVSSGVKVDQSKLASLRPGVTTYNETIALLGPPTGSSMNSDGTKSLQYFYMQAQANAANFIPYVGALVGGSTSEHTTLVVNFGKNGRLTTFNSTQGSNSTGTGLFTGRKQ